MAGYLFKTKFIFNNEKIEIFFFRLAAHFHKSLVFWRKRYTLCCCCCYYIFLSIQFAFHALCSLNYAWLLCFGLLVLRALSYHSFLIVLIPLLFLFIRKFWVLFLPPKKFIRTTTKIMKIINGREWYNFGYTYHCVGGGSYLLFFVFIGSLSTRPIYPTWPLSVYLCVIQRIPIFFSFGEYFNVKWRKEILNETSSGNRIVWAVFSLLLMCHAAAIRQKLSSFPLHFFLFYFIH